MTQARFAGDGMAPCSPPRGSLAAFERVLHPLDALRRAALACAVRVPGGRHLLADRDRRLLVQSCIGVSVAFAIAARWPALAYVVAPAVFGVPHVVAELRFLVVRRAVERWWTALLAAGAVLLLALRGVEMIAPSLAPYASLEVGLGWGLGLAGAVSGGAAGLVAAGPCGRAAAGRRWLRALAVAMPLSAILVMAARHPALAQLAFAHAHNVITIAVWLYLFRRRPAFALPALGLLAGGAAWLGLGGAFGALDPRAPFVTRFVDEAIFAWPRGLVTQAGAVGIACVFVFLQGVHYAVWLSWIPQEDLRAEGTATFRMSYRSLLRDLGAPVVAIAATLTVAMLAASFVSVYRTRALYLSLATFHGYLEVGALAFALARGQTRARPRALCTEQNPPLDVP
jgi:hypothetical protein